MLKKLQVKSLFYAGVLTAIVWAHPFHVSITTFQLNPKSSSIDITMKLFTDDLENALRVKGTPPLKIGTKNEYTQSDSLIFRYLINHLQLSLDEKPASFKWLGKEIEHDITWCYIEVKNVERFSKASIRNTIFVADFDDQLNISHFYKGDQIETIMHHKGKISGTIQFQGKED